MTKLKFAKLLNKSHPNIYDIFKRETVDTGLLLQVSEILEHDFFQYYVIELDKIRTGGKKSKEKAVPYVSLSELKKQLASADQKLIDQQNQIEALKKENAYVKEINDLLKNKKK